MIKRILDDSRYVIASTIRYYYWRDSKW